MYLPPEDEFPPRLSTRLRWAFPWLASPLRLATAGLVAVVLIVGAQQGVAYLSVPPARPDGRPELSLLQGLAVLAEESRGIESLLVMLDNPRERREQENRLLQQHERIGTWLTAHREDLSRQADAGQVAALQAELNAWRAVQRQIIVSAADGQAGRDGVAKSRQLLIGDSAQAYGRLQHTIEGLSRHFGG